MGFAIVSTSLVSLSTEYIPADRLGEGIGYLGLGQVFSSAVAPGVGISIARAFGMKNTFITAGILVVISFFLLFAFNEGGNKVKRSEKFKINLKDIIALKALNYTMVASVFSFINGIIASYLVLYADEMHISGIRIYFTVYAIVLFLVRPISGKVMDKKGVKVIIIPAVIITALSMFLLGRATTLIFVLLTAVLRSIGQGAAQPTLQAACIKKVGKEHSGVATSTYFLGGDIGQGIGPMLGGYLLGQISYSSGYKILFDLCGALLICVLVIFLIIERKRGGERS
jgi:MFS family permease